MTSIMTGPVRVGTAAGLQGPGLPNGESACGKVKRRQAHRPASHVSGPQGIAGTPSTTCPPSWNRIATWFRAGSSANTACSRVTVTTSPGEAKGVVTEPRLDGKVRGAAGMTLQEATAEDAPPSMSAARASHVTT